MLKIFKKKIGYKSIDLVSVLVFLEMVSVNLTNSAIILFALDLDASIIEINVIKMATIIIPLIFQIPFGIISDKLGRKSLIILQQITFLSTAIIRSLAKNPFHLIISSVVRGIGGGLFFPQLLSIIADISKLEEKSLAISRFYIFSSIGMMTGPGLASMLLTRLPLRDLFIIETALRIVSNILVFIWIKNIPKSNVIFEPSKTSYSENVKKLLKRRNMLTVIEMAGCFTFFRAVMGTYTPVYARDVGLNDSTIVLFGMFSGMAIFLSRMSLEKLIENLKHKRILLSMLAICVVVGLTMPFSKNFFHIAIEMVLMGSCVGVLEPLGSIIVAHTTSRHERGFGNALNHFMKSLGSIATIILVPVAVGPSLVRIFPIAAFLPLFALGISSILMEPVTDVDTEMIES
jgi:MFS family permease